MKPLNKAWYAKTWRDLTLEEVENNNLQVAMELEASLSTDVIMTSDDSSSCKFFFQLKSLLCSCFTSSKVKPE
jgi:hypothetical protein